MSNKLGQYTALIAVAFHDVRDHLFNYNDLCIGSRGLPNWYTKYSSNKYRAKRRKSKKNKK